MGAGYSGYQNKTGLAKDNLPENLTKLDTEQDGQNQIEAMEQAREHLVEEIDEKIRMTRETLHDLNYDLERVKRQISKSQQIGEKVIHRLDFLPIDINSTLHYQNKKLLEFFDNKPEPVENRLLFEYKTVEPEQKLLFDYKSIRIPKKSTLSTDNKDLLQF